MYSQLLVFSLVAGCASSLFIYYCLRQFPAMLPWFARGRELAGPGPLKMFFQGGGDRATPPEQDERVEEYEPALQEIPYKKTPEPPGFRMLEDVDPGLVADLLQSIAEHRDLKSAYYLVGLLHTTSTMNSRNIGEMLAEHPVLVDKIMKTANSSYYCLAERVEGIDRAIAIVGHDAVMEMIVRDYLPTRVAGQMHLKIDEFNRQWRHAIAVAVCAKYLNVHLIPWEEGDIFSTAIFHDIGKLFFPLLGKNGRRQDRATGVIDEESLYGVNHSLVGGLLGADWQLPAMVSQCIAYHHNPQLLPLDSIPAPYLTPCFIICLADLICGVLGYGASGSLLPIREEYFIRHGLSCDLKDIVTPAMIREIDQACRKAIALRK